jgi:hypothetical protein
MDCYTDAIAHIILPQTGSAKNKGFITDFFLIRRKIAYNSPILSNI